jgi:F-type H+-transporting ATPase subunit alpha
MKSIAGGLRLDIANFRSLEAFAQLGTELDKATQSQLDRGYRIVEVLKQPQYKPMHVVDQVMIIYAATKGYIDTVPIKQVRAWEEQFLAFMRDQRVDVRNELKDARRIVADEIDKETKAVVKQNSEGRLRKAIEEFKLQFKA